MLAEAAAAATAVMAAHPAAAQGARLAGKLHCTCEPLQAQLSQHAGSQARQMRRMLLLAAETQTGDSPSHAAANSKPEACVSAVVSAMVCCWPQQGPAAPPHWHFHRCCSIRPSCRRLHLQQPLLLLGQGPAAPAGRCCPAAAAAAGCGGAAAAQSLPPRSAPAPPESSPGPAAAPAPPAPPACNQDDERPLRIQSPRDFTDQMIQP